MEADRQKSQNQRVPPRTAYEYHKRLEDNACLLALFGVFIVFRGFMGLLRCGTRLARAG